MKVEQGKVKRILVIGSLNMDMVTNVAYTPIVGETTIGKGLTYIPGGKGANQAVAIGRLGGDVSMLGVVGNDKNGQILKDNLKNNNVYINNIVCTDVAPTGMAFVMVNRSGDNSIVVIPGANNELDTNIVNDTSFKDFDYLVAQMEIPIKSLEYAFELAKRNNIYTVLNPAPARELSKKLLQCTDLLIPNETEFEILTGYDVDSDESIKKGVEQLRKQGINEIVLTLGDRGARYFSSSKDIYIPSYKVDVIDTTAAGDSFIGALLTAISNGKDIVEAMEFAMKAGALTVSLSGAQSSLPDLHMVQEFDGTRLECT
jgi:ribokinase